MFVVVLFGVFVCSSAWACNGIPLSFPYVHVRDNGQNFSSTRTGNGGERG